MSGRDSWFTVDIGKLAGQVRRYPLGRVVKEMLSNSLDAKATAISLTCAPVAGRRADRQGLRAFEVTCIDDGDGCDDPEMLRRLGSSTSDGSPKKWGRFGRGLIDVLAIADEAEIRTLNHRLVLKEQGVKFHRSREPVRGMVVHAGLRHAGEGFESIEDYFRSVILPPGVVFRFNGSQVACRAPRQTVCNVSLATILYDDKKERCRELIRRTSVEIHPCWRPDEPMIYELGIPVDTAPWSLPLDINVLQKTPLSMDRQMLPEKYKQGLVSQLIGSVNDDYIAYMQEHGTAPPEIRDNRANAVLLSDDAQRMLVKTVTHCERDMIVRAGPGELSEAQELECQGYKPVNRGSLPEGVSELVKDAPTVKEVHDQVCKPRVRTDPDFPEPTPRERRCLAIYAELASALLGVPIRCERMRSGNVAGTFQDGVMTLNIEVEHLWADPLGEESLSVILHECAHHRVSGHNGEMMDEIERLGARLARWVAANPNRWHEFEMLLNGMDDRP